MDYKEKYEQACEKMKAWAEGKYPECFDSAQKTAELIFPELKESGDERIREELLEYLIWLRDFRESGYAPSGKYDLPAMIAWLEKQGEQKPTDKVEPKFKVGDWITDGNITIQIEAIKNGCYLYCGDCALYSTKTADKVYHLWTIQDAKDGDILHSIGFNSDCVFIFNGLDNWKFDAPDGERVVATGYCCLSASADKMEFGIQGPDCIEVDTVKPATKIQRDLLFAKMREAGYEWDAESKEVKKVEQIHVWSDKDLIDLGYLAYFVDQNGDKFYGKNKPNVVKWIYSFPNRTIPQQEWSEEDEAGLSDALWAIEQARTIAKDENDMGNLWYAEHWLKSIKDRVKPQQEWSQNDIDMIDQFILCCKEEHDRLCNDKYGHQDIVSDLKRDCHKKWDWLESLKNRVVPQNRWKPSEEQMIAHHHFNKD